MTARIEIHDKPLPPQPDAFTLAIDATFNNRPVHTSWHYLTANPHEVVVVFYGQHGVAAEWKFARSLLLDGLTRQVGIGDVQFAPIDTNTVEMTITSPDGTAAMAFPTAEVRAFRCTTYALVPDGTEAAPDLTPIERFLTAAAEMQSGDW